MKPIIDESNDPQTVGKELHFWLNTFIVYIQKVESLSYTNIVPPNRKFQLDGNKTLSNEPLIEPQQEYQKLENIYAHREKKIAETELIKAQTEKVKARTEMIKAESEKIRAEIELKKIKNEAPKNQIEIKKPEQEITSSHIKTKIEIGTFIIQILTVAIAFYTGVVAPIIKPPDNPIVATRQYNPNERHPSWLDKLLEYLHPLIIPLGIRFEAYRDLLDNGVNPLEVRNHLVSYLESLKKDAFTQSDANSISAKFKNLFECNREIRRIDTLINIFQKFAPIDIETSNNSLDVNTKQRFI